MNANRLLKQIKIRRFGGIALTMLAMHSQAQVVGQFFDTPIEISDGQTLDLDGNGTDELVFTRTWTPGTPGNILDFSFIYVDGLRPVNGAEILITREIEGLGTYDRRFPSTVDEGVLINEDLSQTGPFPPIFSTFEDVAGTFNPIQPTFDFSFAELLSPLGVVPDSFSFTTREGIDFVPIRFTIEEAEHFGWVALSATTFSEVFDEPFDLQTPYSFQLHGFAYATEPNTGLIAGVIPEPASLTTCLLIAGLCQKHRRRRYQGYS